MIAIPSARLDGGMIMKRALMKPWSTTLLGAAAVGSALVAGLAQGCGDSGTTTTSTGSGGSGGSPTTTVTASTSSSTQSSTNSTNASTTASSSSGGAIACMMPIVGPTRGSAIAVTPDDSRLVAVNRDVGSVAI